MRFIFSCILLATLCLTPSSAWTEDSNAVPEIEVRALMESPEKHSQKIRVSGVVSQVVEDANVFGLIDLAEFKTCKKVTCASLVLPVRWEDSMPEIGQQLIATGEIQKEGERYIFIASKLTDSSQ